MASGQTVVQYGSTNIFRCELHRLQQKPLHDQSGTDLKSWQFLVSLTGYIQGLSGCVRHTIKNNAGTDITIRDGSATDSETQLRWRLPPRQAFRLAMGCSTTNVTSGKTILYAEASSSNLTIPSDMTATRTNALGGANVTGMTFQDTNDGPRCLSFDIVHVAADNLFRVVAVFEVCLVQCADDGTANSIISGVTTNRWSCADSIDHNKMTIRIYRGVLELLTADFSPHWFRYLVVPPLQDGFRRQFMEFAASEDGKKLVYVITDKEVVYAAPWPASTMSIVHTEATIDQNNIVGTGHCQVSLEGPSNCDKMQLIAVGLQVLYAKLAPKLPDGTRQLTPFGDLTITDFVGEVNAVQISATCKAVPLAAQNVGQDGGALNVRSNGFKHEISFNDFSPAVQAFVKQYDPKQSIGGRPGDPVDYQGPASLVGIFRCYLQDPCTDQHGINNSVTMGGMTTTNQLAIDYNQDPKTTPQASFVAAVVDNPQDTTLSTYSQSQLSNPYTYYRCDAIHKIKPMRVANPIAAGVYSGSGVNTNLTTAIVQLAAAQWRYIVRFVAERINAYPEMPDPENLGAVTLGVPAQQYATISGSTGLPPIPMVFMGGKRLASNPMPTADGQIRNCARFDFIYALLRAPTPQEILKLTHSKWSTDNSGNGSFSDQNLTNSQWK